MAEIKSLKYLDNTFIRLQPVRIKLVKKVVVNKKGVVSSSHLVLLNTTIFVHFSLKIIFD